MKKNMWMKIVLALALILSFAGVNVNEVQATNTLLSEGVYTVGKEIPTGLNKFKISAGYAEIDVYRNQDYLVEFQLDSEKIYSPDEWTVNLKAGDEIEVYFYEDTTNLVVEKLTKVDLKKLTAGYYEVGTDIPTGTYLIGLDHSPGLWDSSYVEVYDSKGNYKDYVSIYEDDKPVELKFVKGDKFFISDLIGTMSFKEKIIVPTSIKLSKTSLNITPKQTYKVTAIVSPSNAIDKTLVWKSSNTKVATVDASGNIKGIAKGSTTITATSKSNSKVKKTVSVKVEPKTVKLNKTSLSMMTGKTGTLSATVSPADSKDKGVTWKSSNTKVATVDSKGKVTGKAKGTVTITASAKSAKSATAKVTITAPVAAKSVKMNKTSAKITKGKTVALSASISPSNTTNKTLKWISSNSKVAKVDSKGKVTAVGAGTAKITATTSNGKSTSATITVPYSKTLSAGTWKGGTDLPAGRYKITTSSDFGNLFITTKSFDRDINEILSSTDDGFGVTSVTTDIKSGDKIKIDGLKNAQFTKVTNVKSNTLGAGHWTVGKDINPGRYKITPTKGSGNLFVYRSGYPIVNEILSKESGFGVPSYTTTLKTGDHIEICFLNKVTFTKK